MANIIIITSSDQAKRIPRLVPPPIVVVEEFFFNVPAQVDGPAIICFKYLVETRNCELSMFLSGNEFFRPVVDRVFEFSGVEEAPRSFHEIIPAGILKQGRNELRVQTRITDQDPFGKIVFSDIYFLY